MSDDARAPRNRMDRFIDGIELLAAVFVGIVAADVFISVLLRYFFAASIPDSYDFGKLLLGILIFWGIAATSYRGTHITVDLVWVAAGPRCGPLPAGPPMIPPVNRSADRSRSLR